MSFPTRSNIWWGTHPRPRSLNHWHHILIRTTHWRNFVPTHSKGIPLLYPPIYRQKRSFAPATSIFWPRHRTCGREIGALQPYILPVPTRIRGIARIPRQNVGTRKNKAIQIACGRPNTIYSQTQRKTSTMCGLSRVKQLHYKKLICPAPNEWITGSGIGRTIIHQTGPPKWILPSPHQTGWWMENGVLNTIWTFRIHSYAIWIC
jgi:hypothetical protein